MLASSTRTQLAYVSNLKFNFYSFIQTDPNYITYKNTSNHNLNHEIKINNHLLDLIKKKEEKKNMYCKLKANKKQCLSIQQL